MGSTLGGAKDLSDTMNKLDRWDAQIRDNEMKFEKDDISNKMRQAALFAMAPKAVVENRLAGRRDLDNFAKVRCMIDDMIRDKREARGAIRLSGGGNQPPTDVDRLKLREVTSVFAEEVSEGGSDTSSVQKLAESRSAIVEKGKKGQWTQESSTGGAGHTDEQMRDLSVEYGLARPRNEMGVYTTRTVQRVPNTAQKRADLVKGLQ